MISTDPRISNSLKMAMKASVLSFWAAVAFLVAGLIWGLVMGISQDFSTMPAHAHLNLLGWVSLFLFGIYYRLHPWLEGSRSAHVDLDNRNHHHGDWDNF